MKLSPPGAERLKRYEALRLTIYRDSAGKPTIGWGHLLSPEELADSQFARGITQDQADEIFLADIAPAEADVQQLLQVGVSQAQFDSLVSFQFNTGGLKGSKLLRAINDQEKPDVVRAQFVSWDHVHVDGEVVEDPGLRARRVDEASAWPDLVVTVP